MVSEVVKPPALASGRFHWVVGCCGQSRCYYKLYSFVLSPLSNLTEKYLQLLPFLFEGRKTSLKSNKQEKLRRIDNGCCRWPVLWLTWHLLLIKRWFRNHRVIELVIRVSVWVGRDWGFQRRLNAWDSVFGKDILLNSNVENPKHLGWQNCL